MYKIAIMGKANTGKNTLARMLVRQLRAQWRTNHKGWLSAKYIAFADPIKKMIMEMFPRIPKKHLFGSSKFRNEVIPGAFKDGVPLTIRQLLIDLGSGVGRELKPDVWLDNFDYRFDQAKFNNIVIVTDVRFRNEFEHLRKNGFYMIRLIRDTGQPTISHVSETGQEDIKDEEFDYVLHNDHSLKNLQYEVVKNILPRLIND